MTLQELCEPIFQEICRLNRLARKGGGSAAELGRDMARVRSVFEEMKSRASGDVGLLNQYMEVEKPLVYFVDFMLSESKLPWAGEWPWLEQEKYQELVGQMKFFELLDETLVDPSPAATDRLQIFYTCIGLGFTGFYVDEPEVLRRKMLEIQNRIRDRVELQETTRFIPESEMRVNTSNLYEPPGRRLGMLVIALVGLVMVLFIANFWLYSNSQSRLSGALDQISGFTEEQD